MRRPTPIALLLFATVAFGCGGMSRPADLDVTRVVLYQSGIAYVERAGGIVGDELVMPIRQDQINDILASLIVVDQNGRGGASVSLPIAEGAASRLADLPPELRNAGGLVAILHAFRGADVRVVGADFNTRGRIVGVESIDGEPHVTVLTRRDELTTMPVAEVTDIELQNDTLAMGLRRSLDHSLADGEWKPIDVTVRFTRAGSHDIVMAYVVEMPIWKPAYRVVLDDDGTMLLQGWAVVDNTSGVDWTEVRLSLTAGTPLSFRYDLHSPVFVERPDLTGYGAPNVADLRPPTPTAAAPPPRQRSRAGVAAAEAAPMMDVWSSFDEDAEDEEYWDEGGASFGGDAFAASGGVSAEVEDLGGVFRFDIPGRVTLPDQTSTMVTLVNTTVAGEDALIFQPDAAPASHTHPYRALRLENDTRYPVQRAPVAIYARGTFVGEGITPPIAPAESAVVPYAIESRVRVTQQSSSTTGDVTLIRIIDGVIHVESEHVQGTDYGVRSSLPDAQRIWLKVPRLSGYDLRVPEGVDDDDVQREAGYYLIAFGLDAGGDETFRVEQVSRQTTTMDIFGPGIPPLFHAYLSNAEARPDVAAAMEPILEMLAELGTLDRRYAETTRLRTDVQQRTFELRENIRVLGDSPANAELRETLVDRLSEQDLVLDRLAGEIVEISEGQSSLRVRISEALREVRLESGSD